MSANSQTLNQTSSSLKNAQMTLKREVSYKGIGIHTGHQVHMKFIPLEKNRGIIFKRVDLPNQPEIPATIEYVIDTRRNTTIGIGEAHVYTIEHVMAALYASGVDNLMIEIDGPEPPVGDGSSDIFLQMVEEAELEEQEAIKATLVLDKPLYFSQGDIHIVALPSDHYHISYTLNYPKIKAIGSQYFSTAISTENFKKELSKCRTFALYNELKMLMDAGLIRGGSLDNAVVVHDQAVFSKEGLVYPNEMVRHKILDMVGDLSLIGFRIQAHILSVCSGHATNVAFARQLFNHFTMENVEWNNR